MCWYSVMYLLFVESNFRIIVFIVRLGVCVIVLFRYLGFEVCFFSDVKWLFRKVVNLLLIGKISNILSRLKIVWKIVSIMLLLVLICISLVILWMI